MVPAVLCRSSGAGPDVRNSKDPVEVVISLLDKAETNGLNRSLCLSNPEPTTPSKKSGSVTHETNLSAQQDQASPHTRFQGQNADQRRNPGDSKKTRQRTQAIVRVMPGMRHGGPLKSALSRMGSFSFPKTQRILKRKDFVNLNRSGKKVHTKHFLVMLGRSGSGRRLGITASKRTGNAVQRNRIKRLVREFFRLNKSRLPHGVDMVVAAKRGAANLDFLNVHEELGAILFDPARRRKAAHHSDSAD